MEINGKFFIVGMYTPDIAVSQLPYIAPTLTVLMWLESDRPGNFQFRAKLSQLETGAVLAQAMGGVQFIKPGVGLFPMPMQGIRFSSAGSYTFSVQFDDQRDELITSFSLILKVPVMPTVQGVPGPLGFPR
jgi:hypothetical protein